MKEINEGTFLRAYNNPLAIVKIAQYGNSLFGDFTTLVSVDRLFFVCEARHDYMQNDSLVYALFYCFDNEKEAIEYFDDALSMANEYTDEHGTVAGGF